MLGRFSCAEAGAKFISRKKAVRAVMRNGRYGNGRLENHEHKVNCFELEHCRIASPLFALGMTTTERTTRPRAVWEAPTKQLDFGIQNSGLNFAAALRATNLEYLRESSTAGPNPICDNAGQTDSGSRDTGAF